MAVVTANRKMGGPHRMCIYIYITPLCVFFPQPICVIPVGSSSARHAPILPVFHACPLWQPLTWAGFRGSTRACIQECDGTLRNLWVALSTKTLASASVPPSMQMVMHSSMAILYVYMYI